MKEIKFAVIASVQVLILACPLAVPCFGQEVQPTNNVSGGVSVKDADARYQRLEGKMQDVIEALGETRAQLQDSHQQIEQLRRELGALEAQLSTPSPADTDAAANKTVSDLHAAVSQLQDDDTILQAEVKQHEQTKVESVSKYPVKISGMILLSSFLNSSPVDDADLPTFAVPPAGYTGPGNLTASPRQSVFGIDAGGPHVWGAESSASVRMDFFGGFATSGYDATSGVARLRTAHFKLDWPSTSLAVGVDTPLISPLQPTSYLTVAQPTLAWSGNLWTWAPQVMLTHRFSGRGGDGPEFELGVIDPAAPRLAVSQTPRQPSPGESSQQPGYEMRGQYAFGRGDRPMVVGAGGYYARQRHLGGQNIDAWAATADWKVPAGQRFEFTGEFYRGQAIGGLGGGAFKDYYLEGNTGRAIGFDAVGGWSQFKARLASSLEANGAFGADQGFAGELRNSIPSGTANVYSVMTRNRTILGNVIYRPRAYMLLSAEYRNIWSWQITGPANRVNSVGISAGYLF